MQIQGEELVHSGKAGSAAKTDHGKLRAMWIICAR
jgi:hypothetical protein